MARLSFLPCSFALSAALALHLMFFFLSSPAAGQFPCVWEGFLVFLLSGENTLSLYCFSARASRIPPGLAAARVGCGMVWYGTGADPGGHSSSTGLSPDTTFGGGKCLSINCMQSEFRGMKTTSALAFRVFSENNASKARLNYHHYLSIFFFFSAHFISCCPGAVLCRCLSVGDGWVSCIRETTKFFPSFCSCLRWKRHIDGLMARMCQAPALFP